MSASERLVARSAGFPSSPVVTAQPATMTSEQSAAAALAAQVALPLTPKRYPTPMLPMMPRAAGGNYRAAPITPSRALASERESGKSRAFFAIARGEPSAIVQKRSRTFRNTFSMTAYDVYIANPVTEKLTQPIGGIAPELLKRRGYVL